MAFFSPTDEEDTFHFVRPAPTAPPAAVEPDDYVTVSPPAVAAPAEEPYPEPEPYTLGPIESSPPEPTASPPARLPSPPLPEAEQTTIDRALFDAAGLELAVVELPAHRTAGPGDPHSHKPFESLAARLRTREWKADGGRILQHDRVLLERVHDSDIGGVVTVVCPPPLRHEDAKRQSGLIASPAMKQIRSVLTLVNHKDPNFVEYTYDREDPDCSSTGAYKMRLPGAREDMRDLHSMTRDPPGVGASLAPMANMQQFCRRIVLAEPETTTSPDAPLPQSYHPFGEHVRFDYGPTTDTLRYYDVIFFERVRQFGVDLDTMNDRKAAASEQRGDTEVGYGHRYGHIHAQCLESVKAAFSGSGFGWGRDFLPPRVVLTLRAALSNFCFAYRERDMWRLATRPWLSSHLELIAAFMVMTGDPTLVCELHAHMQDIRGHGMLFDILTKAWSHYSGIDVRVNPHCNDCALKQGIYQTMYRDTVFSSSLFKHSFARYNRALLECVEAAVNCHGSQTPLLQAFADLVTSDEARQDAQNAWAAVCERPLQVAAADTSRNGLCEFLHAIWQAAGIVSGNLLRFWHHVAVNGRVRTFVAQLAWVLDEFDLFPRSGVHRARSDVLTEHVVTPRTVQFFQTLDLTRWLLQPAAFHVSATFGTDVIHTGAAMVLEKKDAPIGAHTSALTRLVNAIVASAADSEVEFGTQVVQKMCLLPTGVAELKTRLPATAHIYWRIYVRALCYAAEAVHCRERVFSFEDAVMLMLTRSVCVKAALTPMLALSIDDMLLRLRAADCTKNAVYTLVDELADGKDANLPRVLYNLMDEAHALRPAGVRPELAQLTEVLPQLLAIARAYNAVVTQQTNVNADTQFPLEADDLAFLLQHGVQGPEEIFHRNAPMYD